MPNANGEIKTIRCVSERSLSLSPSHPHTSLAVGYNKAPAPVTAMRWKPERFRKDVLDFYVDYLHTAYSA